MMYLLDAERNEPDEAMVSMMDDLHLSNPGKNFNPRANGAKRRPGVSPGRGY